MRLLQNHKRLKS
jgi:hypothetical protein